MLLTPPNEVERRSMSLFTGMAILEEHFATAYFRFNDDAAAELRPDLRATDNQQEFVERWEDTAQNLANADAMRLLMTFSRMLPVTECRHDVRHDFAMTPRSMTEPGIDGFCTRGCKERSSEFSMSTLIPRRRSKCRSGRRKRPRTESLYYDVWTSFSPVNRETCRPAERRRDAWNRARTCQDSRITVRRYTITTEVQPPKRIQARARVRM